VDLDKKIAELDSFINQFLKERFLGADIATIKPHLIKYIKTIDKNVTTFSKQVSEKTEFAIEEFIKKACHNYYDKVMTYKAAYFNEQDPSLASDKLLDNTLDRFYDNMGSRIDEFLEETYLNQDVSLLSSKLEGILANCEATKLSLRNDKDIQEHAKFFLSDSPYNLEVLLLLEEIIEGFAELAFLEILKKEANDLPEIKEKLSATITEISELLERTKQFETSTSWIQNPKKEKEPISLFSFLYVLWEKIKNLFNQQEPSKPLGSSIFFRATGFPTRLANKEEKPSLADSSAVAAPTSFSH
jgi:hypothetical protein